MGNGDSETVSAPLRVASRLVWPSATDAANALPVPRWVVDAAIDTFRFGEGRSATLLVFAKIAAGSPTPVLLVERRAGAREIAAIHGKPPIGLTPLWVIRVGSGRVAEPTADDRHAALRIVPSSPAPFLIGIEVLDGAVSLAAWELDRVGDPRPVALMDGLAPGRLDIASADEDRDAPASGLEEAIAWELIRLHDALDTRVAALEAVGVQGDLGLLAGFASPPSLEAEARAAHREGRAQAAQAKAYATDTAHHAVESLRGRVAAAESLPEDVLSAAGMEVLPPSYATAPPSSIAPEAVEQFEKARARLLNDHRSRADSGRARRRRRLQLASLLVVAAVAVGAGFATGWLPNQVLPAIVGMHLAGNAATAQQPAAATAKPSATRTAPPGATTITTSPASTTAESPTPTGPSSAPAPSLLQALSSRVRSGCTAATPPVDAIAAVTCVKAGAQISVEQYADSASADARYAVLQGLTGISTNAGGCWDGSPGEVEYGFGRVTCDSTSMANLVWQDTRSHLVGQVAAPTGIAALLDLWWNQVLLLNSPMGSKMTADQKALAALLPASIRSSCQGYDATLDHQNDSRVFDPVGDVIAIDCKPAHGIEDISLMKFTSQAALDAWYSARFAVITSSQPIGWGSGGCLGGSFGENSWSDGRAICYRRSIDGNAAIRWTDGPRLIYGVLNSRGTSIATLTTWLTGHGLP